MPNGSSQIVSKLWNYCNVLRDDGLSYGDYLEQLTYLLFLKMAHEQTQPPWKRESIIPSNYDWPFLDVDAEVIHLRDSRAGITEREPLLVRLSLTNVAV